MPMINGRRRRLILLAAVLALMAAPGTASADSQLGRELGRAVDAGSPGALVLSRDGHRTAAAALGDSSLRPRRPARADDRFRAGSITKSFVATVVLQLAAESKLGLDDTVEQHLAGLLPNGGGVTLRQLLAHTSGLAEYATDPRVNEPFLQDPGYRWHPRALAEIAATLPPVAEPGVRWAYANTNYLLLGLVVERVTGRSLRTNLRERILRPLRLAHTSFPSGPRIGARHLHGYLPGANGLQDVSAYSPSAVWAAGAIVSTTRDVARFYRALMKGRLLPREQLAEMRTIAPATRLGKGGYGLGLLRLRLSCGNAWGHDGELLGTTSIAASTRDGRRQGVVVLNRTGLTRALEKAELRLLDTALCQSPD